jgi:hypothetical protein
MELVDALWRLHECLHLALQPNLVNLLPNLVRTQPYLNPVIHFNKLSLMFDPTWPSKILSSTLSELALDNSV